MATRALDVVTIIRVLTKIGEELESNDWVVKNTEQARVVVLLEDFCEFLAKIDGLEVKVSKVYQELNAFLIEKKFKPVIQPFDSKNGLGVVSVLDKLAEWAYGPAAEVDINAVNGSVLNGFKLPAGGVAVYEVEGYKDEYLVQLLSKSEDSPWIFLHGDDSLSGLDLVKLSFDVMSAKRRVVDTFESVCVPMVDLDVEPDISWLCGMEAPVKGGNYFISQANQQFKMRMDKTGARVKVATSMTVFRSMASFKPQLIINRPFYGWWAQRDLENIPMAAFFADWDALKRPAGSLEDL